MAIAYRFEATRGFGRLDPFFGLATLRGLVVLGGMLTRYVGRATKPD